MNTNESKQKRVIATGFMSDLDDNRIGFVYPRIVGHMGNHLMDTLDLTVDEVSDRKLRVDNSYRIETQQTHMLATAELYDAEWAVLKLCGYPKTILVSEYVDKKEYDQYQILTAVEVI